MKILLILFPFVIIAQPHIPAKVERLMYDIAVITRPIDTVVFENYRYVFSVKGDTNLVRWDLIKKDKLYTDYWKGAFLGYFAANWAGAFFILPRLKTKTDAYLHAGFGFAAGLTANIVVYKLTKSKWIAFAAGIAAGFILGEAKEHIWDKYHRGVVSNRDVLNTTKGGIDGTTGGTIVFGHKELERKFTNPFLN